MQITDYTIELRDIHLYAHHGVMEQERAVGAWFTIDLTLKLDDHSCAYSDSIESTVSYADVYEIICREMKIASNLLEDVCRRIMSRLFDNFASVTDISITLTKDTPPMGGDRLSAAVTLNGKR
ncbi:MAG: dihydroneopterin aldolase [Bacteroidaceae bacterium]|nr:dihydroneopterin aldolase [Bacteroidaceae bacterium]MBR6648726.1 dihydroneopterin aldolase [Bacteroidaceae bacterium]